MLDEREAHFEETELRDLLLGLDALPEKFRRVVPFGTLTLQRHPEVKPFGMDDQQRWSDGRTIFHLYAYADTNEPRASYRLEALSKEERASLWRRRAIVHAVMQRLDDAYHFSAGEDFRLVSVWLGSGDRPLQRGEQAMNRYAWAYSRELGRESASLDFVTFAEEALVTPSNVDPAHAEPIDDAVLCQEFSKARVLRQSFERAGVRDFKGTNFEAPPRCPLFEEFARRSEFDHLELMFSAPSAASPESLFGHLLLRPVWKQAEAERAPSFEPVMEIGAFLGFGKPDPLYVWRGLTGRSTTFFGFSTLADVVKRNTEVDQRTLQRYRLHVSEEEALHVLQRMWELERRGYFPYQFFTENCAAYLQLLLDGALLPEHRVGRTGTLWVMPVITVDAFAALTGANGEPLLSRIPEPIPATGELAREAEREAEQRFDELAEQRPELSALNDERKSRDPRVRTAAYAKLRPLLLALPGEASKSLSRALQQIERYAADQAVARERRLKESARIREAAKGLPGEKELLLERQERFQRERPMDRIHAEASQTLKIRSMLEALPLRPFTEKEQQELEDAAATREAFLTATLLEADLIPPTENRARAAAERDARINAELHWQNGAMKRSGGNQLGIGAGVAQFSTAFHPGVLLKAAAVRELLGEARVTTFGLQQEVHILDAQALIGVEKNLPSLLAGDLDVVRFRTLGITPELGRKSVFGGFGWGAGLSYSHRASNPHRLLLEGTLYAKGPTSAHYERHFAFGLSPELEVPLYPGGFTAGGRAVAFARIPIGSTGANAVRGEVSYAARYVLLGLDRKELKQELVLNAAAPLCLSRESGTLLTPALELRMNRIAARSDTTGLFLLTLEWD